MQAARNRELSFSTNVFRRTFRKGYLVNIWRIATACCQSSDATTKSRWIPVDKKWNDKN